MSFAANVFKVLIASPSDVPKEREAIAATLGEWNSINAQETGKVLLPVMWESHSAPMMGDRPQQIINEQVVRSCDMLVGAFWTRLGSPTGVEESGTVEEIRWFLKQKKPVMLYFSNAPMSPSEIDPDQLRRLSEFKSSIKTGGLLAEYSSVPDLQQQLLRQMTFVLRNLSVSPVVDVRAVRKAQAKAEGDDLKNDDTSDAGADGPRLQFYTDRSFIIVGNSLPFKEALKQIGGGSWINTRHGYKAWCFSNKRAQEVAKALGISPTIASES